MMVHVTCDPVQKELQPRDVIRVWSGTTDGAPPHPNRQHQDQGRYLTVVRGPGGSVFLMDLEHFNRWNDRVYEAEPGVGVPQEWVSKTLNHAKWELIGKKLSVEVRA